MPIPAPSYEPSQRPSGTNQRPATVFERFLPTRTNFTSRHRRTYTGADASTDGEANRASDDEARHHSPDRRLHLLALPTFPAPSTGSARRVISFRATPPSSRRASRAASPRRRCRPGRRRGGVGVVPGGVAEASGSSRAMSPPRRRGRSGRCSSRRRGVGGVQGGVAEAPAGAYLDAVVFDTDDRDEAVKTKILEHQLTHAKCPQPPLSRQ